MASRPPFTCHFSPITFPVFLCDSAVWREIFMPSFAARLYSLMSTTTSVSPRMVQPKVNQLLGPALKSLYDLEIHLRKSTLEPELRELIKLRVSQINRCAYCIVYHRRDALKIGVAERK